MRTFRTTAMASLLRASRRIGLQATGLRATGLLSPPCVARRAAPGAAPARLLSSAVQGSGASRWRGPVTWVSAGVTITGLYSLYQYQYQKQLTRQKSVGKPELGGPFTLMDIDGKPVSNTDLLGQWVLIYFGFTKCPDICPEEMAKVSHPRPHTHSPSCARAARPWQVSEVLDGLDCAGRPVLPVFITIDPSRDTPERLKNYFESHDFHKRTLPLTGSHEALQKACRAYRVYFTRPTPEEIARGDYLLDHSIISYLARAPRTPPLERHLRTSSPLTRAALALARRSTRRATSSNISARASQDRKWRPRWRSASTNGTRPNGGRRCGASSPRGTTLPHLRPNPSPPADEDAHPPRHTK